MEWGLDWRVILKIFVFLKLVVDLFAKFGLLPESDSTLISDISGLIWQR